MKGWKRWSATALLGMSLWTVAGAASTSGEMLREMFGTPPTEWRQQLEANRRLLNDEFFTNVDKRVRWGIENNHVDDAFRFAMVGDFAAEVARRPANYRIDLAGLFFKAQNWVMTRQIVDNIIITSRETPAALEAQLLRGRLKELEKDLFAAYQDYVELGNKKFKPAETWFRAGTISLFRGEVDLAEQEFTKAAAAGSKAAENELERIKQYKNNGWETIPALPNANPNTPPLTVNNDPEPGQPSSPSVPTAPSAGDPLAVARLALADGRVDDAVTGYASIYDPGNPEVVREYAAALYRSGDLSKAKTILDQALAKTPDDAELLRFRGNTLERMYDREGQTDNLKAAIADYRKALELSPQHTLLPWELGRAQAKSKAN